MTTEPIEHSAAAGPYTGARGRRLTPSADG